MTARAWSGVGTCFCSKTPRIRLLFRKLRLDLGARALLATSDGAVLAIDVKTGKTTRFQRIRPPQVSDNDFAGGRLAINFRSGLAVVLNSDGTELFDSDGRLRGSPGAADGAIAHGGDVYLLDGANVSLLGSEGKRRSVATANAAIIARIVARSLLGRQEG